MRLALASLLLTLPAAAFAEPRVLIPPVSANTSDVEVFFLNESAEAAPLAPADRLTTRDAASGALLTLERSGNAPATLAAGGFAKVAYRIAPEAPAVAEAAAPTPGPQPKSASDSFLDRLAPYEPVYAVFGTGSDAAKLQLSAAFGPFRTGTKLDNLRVAYTQTSFWAIEQSSSPFRSTIYSPAIFYVAPVDLAGRPVDVSVGYRHDSNGLAGADSRDMNRLFVRAASRWDLHGGWSLELAPTAWIFVRSGSKFDNYLGYTGLDAAIEQRGGLKLSAFLRGNPGTGRGAAEFLVSYPMADFTGGVGVYLMGQLFTGYGETLLEFDQRRTRARIGIGLVR